MADSVDAIVPDFLIETELQAEAYCKFFLRIPVEGVDEEFTPDEKRKFLARRDVQLRAQLDDLIKLNFKSAQVCQFQKTLFKIAKKVYKKPLSSDGSFLKSSRFNYKNITLMQNRVIYLGQDKECCFGELFHLDIQKYNYAKIIERDAAHLEEEFKFPEYAVYEYEVNVSNVLVLTSESTYKALGIPDRVVKNEWFSINNQFEIPTAGQMLGTMARKKGFQGILYTSVRTQTSNNLVIFEENTGPLDFKLVNETPLDPAHFI